MSKERLVKGLGSTQKITQSTVLNVHRPKEFTAPSTSILLFNATTAIGIIEANPLAKLVIASPLLFTLQVLAHAFTHSTHKEPVLRTSF